MPRLSLDGIKRMAKKLKKTHNTSHMKALEIVAKEQGYDSYAAAVQALGSKK